MTKTLITAVVTLALIYGPQAALAANPWIDAP